MKTISLLLALTLLFNGCAIVMAARQPGKKNLEVVRTGASIGQVRSEFGQPVYSEKNDEGLVTEVYNFTQGYSTGTRASRALFHGVADFFTFFLWEFIGTPAEAVFRGKEMSMEVTYQDGKVIESQILKR